MDSVTTIEEIKKWSKKVLQEGNWHPNARSGNEFYFAQKKKYRENKK